MPWKNGNPPNYNVWRSMLHRCYNTKAKQYEDYRGRGITVSNEWKIDFKQFSKDMGPRPQGTSIERKDNDKGYSKENCKWATRKEQQRNRRVNVYVTIEGITYLAIGLSEKVGIKTDTIVERAARGLSYEEVISKEKFYNLQGFKLGAAISAKKRLARTHCKRGHPFTPENTEIREGLKYRWRSCKRCHTEARWRRLGINKHF